MSDSVQLFQLNTGPSTALASQGTLYLKDLTLDSTIYVPLPTDNMFDLDYTSSYKQHCSICNSPWRVRAEHVYLENKQMPAAVVRFFDEHFHAKVTHESVSTHMKNHCVFKGLALGGIEDYLSREDSVAKIKFKENDFILTALSVELDDIRGINCSKNPELKFKQTAMVNQILDRMGKVKERRDEAAKKSVDIFTILLEILHELTCAQCKAVLKKKVGELRKKLMEAGG